MSGVSITYWPGAHYWCTRLKITHNLAVVNLFKIKSCCYLARSWHLWISSHWKSLGLPMWLNKREYFKTIVKTGPFWMLCVTCGVLLGTFENLYVFIKVTQLNFLHKSHLSMSTHYLNNDSSQSKNEDIKSNFQQDHHVISVYMETDQQYKRSFYFLLL